MSLFIKSKTNKLRKFIRCVAFLLSFLLIIEQSGFAQANTTVDISKHFLALPRIAEPESFRPVHLRSLSYNLQSNDFKIVMDKGAPVVTDNSLPLENTTQILFDYFLIGITLPNQSFWVNLSPDAASNIIDPLLAQTDVGKVFLEADLQLKKDTAQFINPDTKIGREYWEKLYKKAEELFGHENLTIPTFTRPWIVPGEIVLGETQENAYIYKANLKVMLEADYLKDTLASNSVDKRFNIFNEYAAELSRLLIIPKLTYEINTAKRYAPLRQVYYSLILAQWFKQRFYGKGGYYSWLINRRELSGLTSQQPWAVNTYFDAYKQSFKDGEFNSQEMVYTLYGQRIRKYLSGGIRFESLFLGSGNTQVKLIRSTQPQQAILPDYAALAEINTFDMQRQVKIAKSVNRQEIQLIQHPQEEKTQETQANSSSSVNNENPLGSQDRMADSGEGLIAQDEKDPVEDLNLQVERVSENIRSSQDRIQDLAIQKASLREDLWYLEQTTASMEEKNYQTSSPIVLPILVSSGIGAVIGYFIASYKMNNIKKLIAKKDAQIDLLSEQVKTLTAEVRSLRREMAQLSGGPGENFQSPEPVPDPQKAPSISRGSPSGNINIASRPGPMQISPVATPKVETDWQDNPEGSLWFPSIKLAYTRWLSDHPLATTKDKVSRVFSLCEEELLHGVGETLDLDAVDAQFIKGLVDFMVEVTSGAGKTRMATNEESAIIRLEVEGKMQRLLADKELLAKKIRSATYDFSLRGALESTVLEGHLAGHEDLSIFLDDKSLEYQNAFIGFTINKLEISWSEYKKLYSDVYLRLLYEKTVDYNEAFFKIENAVYAKIVEEIPELKDVVASHKSSHSIFRTRAAKVALAAVFITNMLISTVSAAAPFTPIKNNAPIVETIQSRPGVYADTTKTSRQTQIALNADSQVLIPIDRQVRQDTVENKELMKYYEIVKIGETRNTSKINYLRRTLRQHDDSKWGGLTPGALVKFVSPLTGSANPALNAEVTVGGIFDFLKSGVVHLLALGDEQEPSNRVAAEWALGQMRPAVESSWTKRAIIDDLIDALNKDSNPYVRAAAAWALSQYNDSHNILIGTDRDIRIQSFTAATNDKEWIVRYYVVQALATSDDPRAIQPILNLLEQETNPYVIAVASEAALSRNSFGAILPIIQTLEKLQFKTSEDEVLYALDSRVTTSITRGLTAFARSSTQARQQVVMNFIKALQYIQASQEMPNKYEVINYNYLPVFKQLVSDLKIERLEIEPHIQGLDPRICQALFNIITPVQGASVRQMSALKDVDEQYLKLVNNVAKDNPVLVEEIASLLKQQKFDSLSRILLFETSSARRILAVDALSNVGDNASMRALVAALNDSHPTVKAAAARGLRNLIASKQFVYTGKDGSIVKALKNATSNEDWIVVAYLIDVLRSIGDADALQAVSAILSTSKHQLILVVAIQALNDLTNEGGALTQPLLRILSSETDYDVYIQALNLAKEVLSKSDDPLLIDGIINLIVRIPANPQDYSRYAIIKVKATEALSQSQGSLKRLLVLFQEKKERNDYTAANQVLSLLQGLVSPDVFRQLSNSLVQGNTVDVADLTQNPTSAGAVSTYVDISPFTSRIFNVGGNLKTRIDAIDEIGKALAESGHITATEQLLNLIDAEPNSTIIGHAIAAVVKININGMGMISQNEQNPMVKAFTKIANSNKPHAIRQLAIQALGRSGSADAVEPIAGLLQTLRDPLLIKITIEAANELSAKVQDIALADALGNAFAKIATSNRDYEIRQQAIRSLGNIPSVEAAEPLAGLLENLHDPSLILVTVDAAAESFSRNPDNSIIDAMVSVFIEKLDFGPDALAVNHNIAKTQKTILNTLSARKEYTIQLLGRLLKDEMSRSFKEQNPDKIDNIRYLMSLVRSRKAVGTEAQRSTVIVPADILQVQPQEQGSFLKSEPSERVNVVPQAVASQGQALEKQGNPPLKKEQVLPTEEVQPVVTGQLPGENLTIVLPPERVMQRQQQSRPSLKNVITETLPSQVSPAPTKVATPTVPRQINTGSREVALRAQKVKVAQDSSYTAAVNQASVRHQVSIGAIPQAAQKEMQSWISEAPSSPDRIGTLLNLGNSGDNIYVNPFLLRAIREDLKNPDENVRIAAAYVYSKIDPRSVYHVPNTNVDVELLSRGLNSTEINFQERLFKIIALGKTADPLAARTVVQAYYKIQEAYPIIEGQASDKENERSVLAKAVEWALGNMQEAAVDELRITLTTRFNQSKLGYYDAVPMSILARLSPEESNKLLSKMHLNPITQSAESIVAKYSQSGNFYQLNNNIEKKALVFQWDSYNQAFGDTDLQKIGLSPDFDALAQALVSHTHANRQVPIAAAIKLGQMKDVRAVWALTEGLQDDDEFVVAASVLGLSQFESPANEQDIRIPFLRAALNKHTHPFIRANVALVLGTSGDPRAVELLNKLLSKEENTLVKLFAINSAQTLTSKFKNSTLIHSLLTLAREDYNYDPLTIIGLGENWGPVGQAAFDAINAIGERPELRIILVSGLKNVLAEELKQQTKDIRLINDVYSDLLKRFGPQEYDKLSDVMMVVKLQYWLPVVAAVFGGILTFGGAFFLFYSKVFRSKPKLFAEMDTDKIISGSGGKPPEPPVSDRGEPDAIRLNSFGPASSNQVSPKTSFTAEYESSVPNSNVVPRVKAATEEWETLLLHDHLTEAEVSRILQINYVLINLLPFTLTQNGNDLESRASQIDKIINLLDNTINKLTNAIKKGDYSENSKAGVYTQECIDICRYFTDYLLSLGFLEDLHLSANYKPVEEKKAKWRKIWGIEDIAIAAKENLAYLMEKIHTRGNSIVPYLYRVSKNKNEHRAAIEDYYDKIKPSELGIARFWQIRKEMTRLMPLYFGIGFGVFTAVTAVPTLMESFGMGSVLWYLFRVLTSSFMGFGISTYFSWQFIKKGWKDESEQFRRLHAKLDAYEETLRRYFPPKQETNKQQMLDIETDEIIAALSRELDAFQEASADAILFVTSSSDRSALIRDSLPGLIKSNIPVFAISSNVDLHGKKLTGSGASFVETYSYFDSPLTLGDFIDGISKNKDAVCLNKGELNILPKQLQKSMKKTRVIVINAMTPRIDWLTNPLSLNKLHYRGRQLNPLQVALANGYRITQMLKKQNRPGIAHFNGDGVYLGPVREFKDDFTVFASWSSQEQMTRQGLGVLMPDNESNLIKYYDMFKIGKISNWLERETIGGRYDLRNAKKRQMVVSTGILVISFKEEARFSQYLSMLGKIRAHIFSSGAPSRASVKTFPDIIIPLVMLTQGENVYTYLEARLKNLTEENEFIAAHKEEFRKFYLEIYKIIEENFPTGQPFMFPLQIPYPHESVYSRGSAADLSAVLTQYGYSEASSPLIQEFGQPKVPSFIFTQSTQESLIPAQDGATGGIDFRNLKAINIKDHLGTSSLSSVNNETPDEEWQEINRLIKAHIRPSVNRVVDYLESVTQELAVGKRINNVRAGIADILRMEEEAAVPVGSDFKELLELIENNTTVPGLRNGLAQISVKYK